MMVTMKNEEMATDGGVNQGGYESWIPDATYQLYFPQRLNLNKGEEVLIE